MCVQRQKGGAPGHQCCSSAGAAGPGYEPQFAHLSGPGCRAYPGEFFAKMCMLIGIVKHCCVWHKISDCLNTSAMFCGLAGRVRFPYCSGHHG